MNEKAVRPRAAVQKPVRSEAAPNPLTPEATMQSHHAAMPKSGGRLSREDQRRLGDILQRVYDDVIRQGVPDRFRNLLNELDGEKKGGEADKPAPPGTAEARATSEPDRLVEARSFDHDSKSLPQNKGSR
jgi:hypothetical protein